MSGEIRCSACNFLVGAVEVPFIIARKRRMLQQYGDVLLSCDPDVLSAMEKNIELKDILDKLNVTNDCCRTHLITSVDFFSMLHALNK